MRRYLLLSLALVLLSATSSYGAPKHAWVARHASLDHDEPYDVVVSPDDRRVFVTGSTEPYIEGTTELRSSAWLTIALDLSTGRELWTATHNPQANRDDFAYAAAVSPDSGTLLVAGQTAGTGSDAGDATVVAYDASSGEVRWRRSIDGTDDIAPDLFDDLVVTPDGAHAIVVGSIGVERDGGWVPPQSRLDGLAVVLSMETGEIEWQQQWDGTGHDLDHATDVSLSPEGTHAAVIMQSVGISGWMNARAVMVETRDGATTWSRETDFASYDAPLSVDFTSDGSAVVLAGHADGSQRQSFVQKLRAADGQVSWQRDVQSRNYHESVMALSRGGDRLFVVGARPDGSPGGWSATALSLADGSELWTQRMGQYGSAVDVNTLADGTVVVGGDWASDDSTTGFDLVTVGLSPADGTVRWRGSYSGGFAGEDDRVAALTVSIDGTRVFTAGSSWQWDTGSFDFAVSSHGPGCESGVREEGLLSRQLDTRAEPAASDVHEINCSLLAPVGL